MLYVYIGAVLLYLSINSRLTDFALGVLAAYIVERFGERIKSHEKACRQHPERIGIQGGHSHDPGIHNT